ncbi:hypothetical protein Tco_0037668 [Tanacetum coccineum]
MCGLRIREVVGLSLNLFLVCLDRLCHLAILCLDQHAHTMHHLESLLTISLDRLDILKEDLVYQSLRKLSWNKAATPSFVDSKNLLDSVSSSKLDTSLIHIESHKSPTAKLFDVDSGRISIRHGGMLKSITLNILAKSQGQGVGLLLTVYELNAVQQVFVLKCVLMRFIC